MKTTKQWLSYVEQDRDAFVNWLQKQYRGEVRASLEVVKLANELVDDKLRMAVASIGEDEKRHANWIKAILIREGVPVLEDQENADNRYWEKVGKTDLTIDELLAAGAHAEAMRLTRIKAVMESTVFSNYLTNVFRRIYKDELRHVNVFKDACTPDAFMKMEKKHKEGLLALGLEI